MTHKIAKIWNRVSYETMIFIAFLIRFLSTRALDLDTWSSAWMPWIIPWEMVQDF